MEKVKRQPSVAVRANVLCRLFSNHTTRQPKVCVFGLLGDALNSVNFLTTHTRHQRQELSLFPSHPNPRPLCRPFAHASGPHARHPEGIRTSEDLELAAGKRAVPLLLAMADSPVGNGDAVIQGLVLDVLCKVASLERSGARCGSVCVRHATHMVQ